MSNAFNNCTFVGRIPSTDKLPFSFYGKDDPKHNSFMGFFSARRAYKPKDEQYYPEDLIPFKAFGSQATFINEYIQRGDTIALSGEMRRDEDRKLDDGTIRRGELCLYADSVRPVSNAKKKEDSESSSSSTSTTKAAPARNPIANRLRNRGTNRI